jgi:glycosyltransferase involved in cell wall biosynthesis
VPGERPGPRNFSAAVAMLMKRTLHIEYGTMPSVPPLKILRVISRLNTGGPTRHAVLLDAGLRSRGHSTVLAYGAIAAGEASMEAMAAEYGVPTIKVASLGRSLKALQDVRALLRLTALVFAEQPDVVHTHTSKAGMLGRVAALLFNATRRRSRRCAVIHTFHGHVFEGYFSPLVNRVVRAVERALARVSDRIVTISPRQRFDIVSRFGIAPESKVSTIRLGIELDPFLRLPETPEARGAPDFRRALDIGPNDVVVGYVGRLVPIKDPETLMRGFALALQRVGALRLIVAGGGQLRPALERLAESLAITPHVRFLGWTDRLRELYADIDICALSSLNEGTPVAIIEALAAGKPVVATSVGGVPDLMIDGVHGRLVPPKAVDQLAAALVELAADPDLRRQMGAAGRRHVAATYTADRLVDDVERLYGEALKERRTGE